MQDEINGLKNALANASTTTKQLMEALKNSETAGLSIASILADLMTIPKQPPAVKMCLGRSVALLGNMTCCSGIVPEVSTKALVQAPEHCFEVSREVFQQRLKAEVKRISEEKEALLVEHRQAETQRISTELSAQHDAALQQHRQAETQRISTELSAQHDASLVEHRQAETQRISTELSTQARCSPRRAPPSRDPAYQYGALRPARCFPRRAPPS